MESRSDASSNILYSSSSDDSDSYYGESDEDNRVPVPSSTNEEQSNIEAGDFLMSTNEEESNTEAGDLSRPAQTYAQRVNHVVQKVFTTNYEGQPMVWAVFAAGTVVMVPATQASTVDELTTLTLSILKENGPVYPGTPSGDFNAVRLERFFGEGCVEWCVKFEVDPKCPKGTALFGFYIGNHQKPIAVGLEQRNAREKDSRVCQIACTSFDLAPVVWSPETHASFPRSSRALVRLMLLVQNRCANTGTRFVSHEVLVTSMLPMLC